MQDKSLSAFARHDIDRDRLLVAIAELKMSYTFNSPYVPLSEKVNNLAMRLGYILTDTIAMTQVLLEMDSVVRPGAEQLNDAEIPAEVRIKKFIANASYELPAFDKLAVAYKALFFLLRALQDIQYATLLELVGQSAGSGTSMSKCFKSKGSKISNNPIYALLVSDVPQYETWFKYFRDIRNGLKEGRAHGLTNPDGRILLSITLQRGNKPESMATIGLQDVITACEMSAALFQLMNKLCHTESKSP